MPREPEEKEPDTTERGGKEERDYGYSAEDRAAMADRAADRYLDAWFGSGL